MGRLRVHFSSGIVEREKRAWGDFHARSRFARSTIPEEKWGTTCSLENGQMAYSNLLWDRVHCYAGTLV